MSMRGAWSLFEKKGMLNGSFNAAACVKRMALRPSKRFGRMYMLRSAAQGAQRRLVVERETLSSCQEVGCANMSWWKDV